MRINCSVCTKPHIIQNTLNYDWKEIIWGILADKQLGDICGIQELRQRIDRECSFSEILEAMSI
jgi:hypothetical protein